MNLNPPVRHLRLVSLLGLFAAAATSASAAPPQIAYLEKAQTQASGNQIRSYGVPASDSTGKLFYWDVTVDLAIDANGKPNPNATVGAIKQVKVSTSRIVPGTYKDSHGGTCVVSESLLPSGRQEAAISCISSGGSDWVNLSAVNGNISGHPFEALLTAAKIGDLAGYRDYLWGASGGFDGGTSDYSCFQTGHIVAIRQAGTQIVATSYGIDNVPDCGMNMVSQP